MAGSIFRGLVFLGMGWCAAAVAQPSRPDDRLLPAVYKCDIGEVRAALDAGAAPNRQGSALKNHHPDIAELLLANGADVDTRDAFQATPLMAATIQGDLAMVQFLLAHGAVPNAQDIVGTSALMRAAKAGSVELAQLLLAVRNERLPMVELLLDRGADRARRNDDGQLPADLATTPEMRARVAP